MSAWEKATERLKRLGNECTHLYAGHLGWPCLSCVTYMMIDYEEELGALRDRRRDASGWPLRDGPDNDRIVKERKS